MSLKCPICKSEDAFIGAGYCTVTLNCDGIVEESEGAEWDPDENISCVKCSHYSAKCDFETEGDFQ